MRTNIYLYAIQSLKVLRLVSNHSIYLSDGLEDRLTLNVTWKSVFPQTWTVGLKESLFGFLLVDMAADPRLARAMDPRRTATPPQPPPPPPPAQSEQKRVGGYDGAEDVNLDSETRRAREDFKLKFCTVCASNNNRYVDRSIHP